MKRSLLISLGVASAFALAVPIVLTRVSPAKPGWNSARDRFTLPNGWRITPVGKFVDLPGDMPGNIVFVGGKAVVNTSGFHDHSLNWIDLEAGKVVKTVPFPRSWIGLATHGDQILSSGGSADSQKFEGIHRVGLDGSPATGFTLPDVKFVSGITSGPLGLYVLDIQGDRVLRLGANERVEATGAVGYRPYVAVLSPDGSTLAVSNWGDASVTLLDSQTLASRGKIFVKSHPTALAYAPDGRLFVANAGANSVSVIQGLSVIETIKTNYDPSSRIGSTPVALALAKDAKTLFVANAGTNNVTVVDVSQPAASEIKGFIPTERYPVAVAVTPDGKQLAIATGKGYYGPNAGGAVDFTGRRTRGKEAKNEFIYIGDQLAGRLNLVDIPDPKTLQRYSQLVVENTPLGVTAGPSAAERKAIETQAFAKIKHVIYIIRENRTYDQVFGDIPKGNGDPSLTLFGENITPNSHQLVKTFTLFDNLYTDGEVSQSGHQWTSAAYANDYCEKQWLLEYSGRGEVRSDPRLTSSPGEYIWSQARKFGKTARVYGEYVDVQEDHDSLSNAQVKADPEKYGYSASFEKIFANGGRDTEKVADFLREMREAEQTGKWPNLMVMALPEDHTNGFSAGSLSPNAMIANNDLALGQLVDAVSHSKFWKETAIFVIQDDGQAGPDHVDSHRTVGLVISPYVRRNSIDSTMYSTSSMLRTMGLILGTPPLTIFDASATPMYHAFTTKPNFTPYDLQSPRVDVNERNPRGTKLAARSAKLDFSAVDRADFGELNRILWEGYRPGVPYPAPVRGR